MQPADGDPPATGLGVGIGVAGGIGVDVLIGEGVSGKAVAVTGWLDTEVGAIVTRGTGVGVGVGGRVVSAIGSS